MKTIIHYECEVCHQQYSHPEIARACEESLLPPKPSCIIGEEVKLKNRNTGHTLAVVKDLHLVPEYWLYDVAQKTSIEEKDKEWFKSLKQRFWHGWELELDREVCLDHHWEDQSNRVKAFYILTNRDDPRYLVRDDNNCY